MYLIRQTRLITSWRVKPERGGLKIGRRLGRALETPPGHLPPWTCCLRDPIAAPAE